VVIRGLRDTIDLAQRCFGGVETRDGVLWLNPCLPAEVPRLRFTLHYRGQWVRVLMDHKRLRLQTAPGPALSVPIGVQGRVVYLEPGRSREFKLDHAAVVRAGRRGGSACRGCCQGCRGQPPQVGGRSDDEFKLLTTITGQNRTRTSPACTRDRRRAVDLAVQHISDHWTSTAAVWPRP
jgi:hypothetical protein